MRRTPLDRLLTPTSVAVVGASARPGSFGERLAIEALRSAGVSRVDLIHPQHAEVQGRRTTPTLGDLDHAPDLVLMGVPDRVIPEQLAAAAAAGAGGAVVFGNVPGLAADVRRAAEGLALCGAGCMGFVNPVAGVRAIGYLERDPIPAGSIALVTHSGSLFSAMLRTHRRLEYALAVSSGQELGLTAGDYLCWALEREETRVVGLFLETIRDAGSLRRGLALALERDVPVVALTVGASSAGRALVTAHSGAIAGDDAGWEALFASYGVHRVRDVEELVDTLELFAVGRRLRHRSAGIATVHDSGAERTLVADIGEAEDVPFAALADETVARLGELLDDGLVVANPVDVWGRGADTEELFTAALDAVADDDGVDVVALAVDLVEEYDGDESYPHAAARVHATTDKPVVVLSAVPAAIHQPRAAQLREAGIPVLEGARSGLRALGHLRDHADPPRLPAASSGPAGSVPEPTGWRDAVTTLGLLAAYGVSVVTTLAASDEDGAVAAAEVVGYPVVLKTDEPGINHRARLGGVVVGVPDEPSLRAVYSRLREALGSRVVVQPMVTGQAEYALGVVPDPQLGPLVLVAHGGSLIEELGSRALALPEAVLADPARLVTRLGGVLDAAVQPLADAAAAVARLALDHAGWLAALDVNPLILTADGLVAVDALVE
ncbi:acetate--CoA ligase family protein [Nocardioides sp.]|uniref:acetate--CoA ligase family protein n=1 Tax=Nocardioides sp. TaxID=35761 RepID=UPI003527B71D